MGPIRATLHCLTRPVTWSGRASRSEFWWFSLAMIAGSGVAGGVWGGAIGWDAAAYMMAADPLRMETEPDAVMAEMFAALAADHWPVLRVFLLAGAYLSLCSLAVSVRRLHDTGRSGWWYWITLVPFIGYLWFLVLTILPSQSDGNPYGPPPAVSERAKARVKRSLEPYMTPKAAIDVHDTPEAIRALRHSRMPEMA